METAKIATLTTVGVLAAISYGGIVYDAVKSGHEYKQAKEAKRCDPNAPGPLHADADSLIWVPLSKFFVGIVAAATAPVWGPPALAHYVARRF